MTEERLLKMSFDPQTIEHLGVKMYSYIPNAIAELIANAYDADAKAVDIRLYDDGIEKKIEVIDDGVGMDFNEVNTKFLRIGRNRRIEGSDISPGGRKATGKKGLGKLALFGIGDLIEVTTTKEGSGISIKFTLSWPDLKGTQGKDYEPVFEQQKCDVSKKGTTIVLRKLRRESALDQDGLAASLSKLFNCFGNDFRCFVSLNDGEKIEVDNALKFRNIDEQFKWVFPDFSATAESDYEFKEKIIGEIVSTEKPLKPGLRGITLFANGRLVNTAEFFGISESSHVFSYLAGWLNVDFIDNLEDDVISTNRQSLNWELPIISHLRDFLISTLRKIVAEWRIKRNEASQKAVVDQTNINTEQWLSTLPAGIKSDVRAIVDSVIAESEVPTEKQANVIRMVHNLVPEYPYYHWRGLHEEVRNASKSYYENEDYYTSVSEAVKRYIGAVRKSINSTNANDHSMMGEAFTPGANRLNVVQKYKKPDGSYFDSKTIENIKMGQKTFSESVVLSVRNPLAHEEYGDLKNSGLFNEKDCLDALGLISYIFRRLDDAIESQSSSQP